MKTLGILCFFILFFSCQLIAQETELSIQKGHLAGVTKIAFDQSSKLLASGDKTGKVIIWNMPSGRQMAEYKLINEISALCFSSDNKYLLVGENNGNFSTIQIENSKINHYKFSGIKIISIKIINNELCYILNGSQLFMINFLTGKFELIKNDNYQEVFTSEKASNFILFSTNGIKSNLVFGQKPEALGVRFSKGAKKWAKQRSKYQLKIDKNNKSNNYSLYRKGKAEFKLWKLNNRDNADGNGFFTLNLTNNRLVTSQGNKIQIYNYNNAKIVNSRFCFYYDDKFTAAAISDKYNIILAGNTDNNIYLYSAEKGNYLGLLKGHLAPVNDIVISPDQKYFASASNDCSIIIWSAENQKVLKRFYPRTYPISAFSIDKKNSLLYYGNEIGYTGRMKVDSSDLQIKFIKNHTSSITGIAHSGDTMCFTSSTDNSISSIDFNKNKLISSNKFYKTFFVKASMKWLIDAVFKSNKNIVLSADNVILLNSRDFVVTTGHKVKNGETLPLAIYKLKGDKLGKKTTLDFKLNQNNILIPQKNNNINYLVETNEGIPDNQFYSIVSNILISWVISNNGVYYKTNPLASQCTGRALMLNKDTLVYQTINNLNFYRLSNNQDILSIPINNNVFAVHQNMIVYSSDNHILIKNINNNTTDTIPGIQNTIRAFSFLNSELFASAGEDGYIKIWNLKSKKLIVSIIPIDRDNEIVITEDNYFYAPKNAIDAMGYKVGSDFFPPEQFDLKYNRPDIVLERLGLADTLLITAFRNAYFKRLKKMKFNEEMLTSDFHLPETTVLNVNEIPIQTNNSDVLLKLLFSDSKYKLDRITIWINDIPIYGTAGINLRNLEISSIEKEINLKLSLGKNKVQVSCMNEKGVESLKETLELEYLPKEITKPNLYIISIGASEYKDKKWDLTYAAKDASDLISLFEKQKDNYKNIYITKILNQQVSNDTIRKIKQQLLKSNIEDVVILFFAGHGLLDENLDYYLGTYNIDFNNPVDKGLKYDDLDVLLDSVPARKKIVFIDACHSGEVDKDEELLLAENKSVSDNIVFRGKEMAGYKTRSNLSYKNSFEMMKELFADLRKGTGTVVISSAGGGEYAFEGLEWKNGVFTYSLINGITTGKADKNNNDEITVSELQDYIMNQVQFLTKGMQKPTSRQENIDNDFVIWKK